MKIQVQGAKLGDLEIRSVTQRNIDIIGTAEDGNVFRAVCPVTFAEVIAGNEGVTGIVASAADTWITYPLVPGKSVSYPRGVLHVTFHQNAAKDRCDVNIQFIGKDEVVFAQNGPLQPTAITDGLGKPLPLVCVLTP